MLKFFEELIDDSYVVSRVACMHIHTNSATDFNHSSCIHGSLVQWCSRMHTYKCEQSYATTAIIPLRGVYRFCLVNPDKDRGKYGAALPQSVKQIQPVLIRVSMHLFPRAVIQFNEIRQLLLSFLVQLQPCCLIKFPV